MVCLEFNLRQMNDVNKKYVHIGNIRGALDEIFPRVN